VKYDPITGEPTGKIDHVPSILDKIPTVFRTPFALGMIGSWAKEIQAAEDAFWQLFTERFLSNATGAALDAWGRIAGESRNGELDTPYRLRVVIRFAVNRSRGNYATLYGIAKLAVGHGNFRLWRGWKCIGLWVFEPVTTPATPAQIKAWMVRAKPLGDSFFYCDSSGGSNYARCTSTDDPIPALNESCADVNAPGAPSGQCMGVH